MTPSAELQKRRLALILVIAVGFTNNEFGVLRSWIGKGK